MINNINNIIFSHDKNSYYRQNTLDPKRVYQYGELVELSATTAHIIQIVLEKHLLRSIMIFLRSILVEHMGEVEANEKLNNVWQMVLP